MENAYFSAQFLILALTLAVLFRERLLQKVFSLPGRKKKGCHSQEVAQLSSVLSGPVLEESKACELNCMAPVKCDYCYLGAFCKFMNALSSRLKPN